MNSAQKPDDEDIRVKDDSKNHRYVLEVNGKGAGLAVYHVRAGKHLFVHTEINDDFVGRGLGSKLVRYALDDVREKQGSVVAICPFFASFISRHPEYEDLVDVELTERINGLHNSG